MSDTTQLLDQLDTAHAAASRGPWQHDPAESDTIWDGEQQWPNIIATTRYPREHHAADAALIVAAVNALPQLTTAIRGVLQLADAIEADQIGYGPTTRKHIAARIRTTIADALTPAPQSGPRP